MKLTIGRDELADLITWAARAIPTRPSMPALAGLHLQADNNTLTVSAFDYDMSARGTTTPFHIGEPGTVLLPGRLLAQIVASLPGDTVEIFTEAAEAVLACGKAEFRLLTMPVDDYPTLPQPPATLGTVDAATLRAALAQVTPAASPDETLIMLTGVRIDLDDNHIEMAATDRYRIAATTLPFHADQPGTSIGIVAPAKTLRDTAKHLPDGPAHIGADNQLLAITSADRTTTLRLLDDQFIDYRARLTDDKLPITASVPAAALIEAVKRVALVAERSTAVRLAFTQGQVRIQAGGPDIGRGTETVGCELKGDDIEIAFQHQFLLDGLAGVNGQARISMVDGAKPALVRGGDDDTFRYLAMSLRVS